MRSDTPPNPSKKENFQKKNASERFQSKGKFILRPDRSPLIMKNRLLLHLEKASVEGGKFYMTVSTASHLSNLNKN